MRAIIFHGSGGSPNSYWIPYIKHNLEACGYDVIVPQLPNTNIEESLTAVINLHYDCDTILVGHSSGCPLILSVLENINVKVKKAVLVAGYFESLNPPEPEPMVQEQYDWQKIKAHSDTFIFIHSDNDPWGCTDTLGKRMQDKLGGQLVVLPGEGHMGSTTYNQPYKEFPFLLDLIK